MNTLDAALAAARFWSKVDRSEALDACWPWDGPFEDDGRAYCSFDGRKQRPHRVAYALTVGPVPERMFLRRRCTTASCVRPSHHFVSTRASKHKHWEEPRKPYWHGVGEYVRIDLEWLLRKFNVA